MLLRLFLSLIVISLFSGCVRDGARYAYAPVENVWKQPAKEGTYIVRRGDTLYSIAWNYDLDYRALAARNSLRSPYQIFPGQVLQMSELRRQQPLPATAAPRPIPRSMAKAPSWQWPARGRIVARYSPAMAGNKGVNIAGRLNEPVRAAAAGRVVYSGDGVRGYGNLIIIKHNSSFLSAYAYNQRNLVRVGDRVQVGQMIARMGQDNAGKVMLHFEIRRNGHPVNPQKYL